LATSPVKTFDHITRFGPNQSRGGDISKQEDKIMMDKLNIFTATWNVGGLPCPQSVQNLLPSTQPDILAIGIQEVNSKDLPSYLLDDTLKHKAWMQLITSALFQDWPDTTYVPLGMQSLGPLLLLVFQASKFPIPAVSFASLAFGMAGVLNNKGAVAIRMEYALHSQFVVTIVNAHLAPFVKGFKTRNEQYHTMTKRLVFFSTSSLDDSESATAPLLKQTSRQTSMYDSDFVIVMGDLNYRIEPSRLPDSQLLHLLESKRYATALESDQLLLAQKSKSAFHPFSETPIRFAPTYKYLPHSANFDTKRMPAYCDRILYVSPTQSVRVSATYHAKFDVHMSDHRPVVSEFLLTLTASTAANRLKDSIVVDKWWRVKMYASKAVCLLLGLLLSFLFGLWSVVKRCVPGGSKRG